MLRPASHALFLSALLCATGAHATTLHSYVLDISSGCCGSGPYGTVTLTENGANEVDFSVTLNDPFVFVSSGFPGVFAFNVNVASADLTITLDAASIAAGFSGGSAGTNSHPEHMNGFGFFDYVILPDADHGSPSNPIGKSLSFSVVSASPIGIASFESNSINGSFASFFGADVKNTTLSSNETGIVGHGDGGGIPQDVVPEPGTFLIAGIGLAALGLFRRTRAA